MKVFIVFISLLVINVSFLSYQGDMNKFVRQQATLKYIAEECAATAATIVSAEEYANGRIVFDYESGNVYAENFAIYTLENWGIKGSIKCTLEFEDEDMGYSLENVNNKPAVTATVKLDTEDIFRLPILSLNSITRKARYQLE